MDPLSRAALAGALLLALCPRPAEACTRFAAGHVHVFAPGGQDRVEMGVCVGERPVPPPEPGDDAPASAREFPADARQLRLLNQLSIRPDAASDRLIGPGGPISRGNARALFAPVDAAQRRIGAEIWTLLHLRGNDYEDVPVGYQLDDATCRLRHAETGELLGLDLAALESFVHSKNQLVAVEQVMGLLRGLEPGAPVPPAVLERLRQMRTANVSLPPNLQALVERQPPPLVSQLRGPLNESYAALNAFFDQQSGRARVGAVGLPSTDPGAVAPARTRALSSEEARLGQLIAADLQAVFAQTASGRELLASYTAADGTVRLPTMLVLKLSQRPDDTNQAGAIYDPVTRDITMNHWELVRATLETLPPAQRAARAREFADTSALRRYLSENPAARRRAVEQLDALYFHELVHHRQDNRARNHVAVESRRRNMPAAYPLTLEHEAYLEHCRYSLERVSADPSLLRRNYLYPVCTGMLRDPAAVENSITDQYLRDFAGVAPLPELSRIQAARRGAVLSELLSSGVSLERRGELAMRLIGLWHGDDAIAAETADYARSRARIVSTIDAVRAGAATVPARLHQTGDTIRALAFAAETGATPPGDATLAFYLDAARLVYARDNRSTRDERLSAVAHLVMLSTQHGFPVYNETAEGYIRDIDSLLVELRRELTTAAHPRAVELRGIIEQWSRERASWAGALEKQRTSGARR